MNFSFNELSSHCIKSAQDLDAFYKQIRTYVNLTKRENLPSIIFNDTFASENYNGIGTIYNILKDSSLDEEEKNYLKGLIQNSPFSLAILDDNISIKFNGEIAKGFQYSAIHGLRSISIPSDKWGDYTYSIEQEKIDPVTGDIISKEIEIEHLGNLNNYAGKWLEAFIPLVTYSNANEFLERIPQNYPYVVLSEHAKTALIGFNTGKLKSLERSMKIFNTFCQKHWRGSVFRKHLITELGVTIKGESEQTMDKYGHQRNFKNEHGKKEIIPLHFNISDDHRGNIKPIEGKKIYIAYLGMHLSTVKYK
ncbi:hypothetical protein [Aliivibrio sifiae]|uniref:hypothetical protein n=1 Tax=Aliivibrio sifiae TaxID=566293 RepID=UPI003D0ADDE5